MDKEEVKNLLNLVMNVLTEKWDKIEEQDPDQSTEKWMGYKRIRNNIRDSIKEIAVSKGIELL
jgi:hypothetical protein